MSEVETSFRVLPGQVELSSVDGDDRTRQMVLRHLEPILDRDVAGKGRVFGRNFPASSPELDPAETPERACAPRLVALAPLVVLLLEQGAGGFPLREGREGVHDRQRRLPNQQFATDGAREVADPRRKILRRLRFPGKPTEDRLHRTGMSSKQVVVELVGELERFACMVETGLGADPREPTVDDRLKRRLRHRRAQGFLEQRDGITLALDTCKEDKGLGAHGASYGLGEEIGKTVSRTSRVTRASLSARRSERSAMPLVVCVRRRQPQRLLGELGGRDRRPTSARQSSGVLQDTGDLGVWALRRQREMARAVERVRDDEGEACVCVPSLLRGRAVVDH